MSAEEKLGQEPVIPAEPFGLEWGSGLQELHVLGGGLGDIGHLPHGVLSGGPLDVIREIPHTALGSHRTERLALPPHREQTVIAHAPGFKPAPLEISGHLLEIPAFNGTVLAGQPTKYGVQFVTWEWDFDKTGLCWGHYFEDYGKAKQDFATRSGLVAEGRQFSADQLTEVYRTIHDLPNLNRLCQAIGPLKDADMEKLNGVVLLAGVSGIYPLCQLAENLDQFDFVPGIHTPEEYGKYMIQKSGHFEYDEDLEGFYDYRRYGEQRIREEGGQFNECGYVAYHGTLSLEELMQEDPAEQYQREQGQQMM